VPVNSVEEAHVIIITGAGGGIGGAMARGLLRAGRRVVGVDIGAGMQGLSALSEYAATNGARDRLLVTTADVRSEDACKEAIQATLNRFGCVHGLVNNAGVPPLWKADRTGHRFLDVPADYWRFGIETNLTGPFLMALAAGPHLIKSGWGRIVNVTTSFATMLKPGMTPYGAAKAGLEAASAIWAKELAQTGVTVNVLVPGGATDTPIIPLPPGAPERSSLISAEVMVAPIVWLTSQASDGTTGARFIGNLWEPEATVETNLSLAMSPVAWRE
jgi:NAD(P)-dependent dehydrogenase (short-subunit alcohol dehydrogenase family)